LTIRTMDGERTASRMLHSVCSWFRNESSIIHISL